jgi:hypothetical protein
MARAANGKSNVAGQAVGMAEQMQLRPAPEPQLQVQVQQQWRPAQEGTGARAREAAPGLAVRRAVYAAGGGMDSVAELRARWARRSAQVAALQAAMAHDFQQLLALQAPNAAAVGAAGRQSGPSRAVTQAPSEWGAPSPSGGGQTATRRARASGREQEALPAAVAGEVRPAAAGAFRRAPSPSLPPSAASAAVTESEWHSIVDGPEDTRWV